MRKIFFGGFLVFFCFSGFAQIYFPPVSDNQWDTVSPKSLGWCVQEMDTLKKYLSSRNSKSFLMLHRGKLVVEEYMNGFARDSAWYWASAGKSLMAYLVGLAQQDGDLDIEDQTSKHLGTGWTSAPLVKESLIKIRHQLSMTTGLDYNVPDLNCVADTCLSYLHNPGTHWYYYNAPYRLLRDVVEAATGKNINTYTFQKLYATTGITGLWVDYLFISNARSMARFGLLASQKGMWSGTAILKDSTYLSAMTKPSQNLNPAYGYLWWLNGSNFYKMPGTDFIFQGQMIPDAPTDLYMAAGANDQRIYIVPSLQLVVVRQGEAACSTAATISDFDNELWGLIMNLICTNTHLPEIGKADFSCFPNPASTEVTLGTGWSEQLQLLDAQGREMPLQRETKRIYLPHLSPGIYFLRDRKLHHTERLQIR